MNPASEVMPNRIPLQRSGKNTRTRIVERSIALFNRGGLQNVAIEQIASDLQISPGNLTYHFKRKRDLIDPEPPNNFRLLATNLWALWLHWLRMTQIETPHATSPSDRLIAGGVWQLWSMCQLWMPPQFAREMLAVFEDLLGSRMGADNDGAKQRKRPDEVAIAAAGEQPR
jgi:hypothetical protein